MLPSIVEYNGISILGYCRDMIAMEVYNVVLTSKRRNSYSLHRGRLWELQCGRCYWCGCKCHYEGFGGGSLDFTVDHVIPLAQGGTNHWMNLIGSCYKCNDARNKKWRNISLILLPIENEAENEFIGIET